MSTARNPRNPRATTASSWQGDLSHRSSTPTGPSMVEPQDMLHLMRTTRGRIYGNVSFYNIHSPSNAWARSYCFVDTDSAALYFEVPNAAPEDDDFEPLIRDLRGCGVRAVFDATSQSSLLEVLYRNTDGKDDILMIHPDRQSFFGSWYAALLCWHVCRSGQRVRDEQPSSAVQLRPTITNDRPQGSSKIDRSNAPLCNERALLLVEGSPTFSNIEFSNNTTATEVHCVLRGNGELSIHRHKDRKTLVTVQMRALPRSAIQYLHRSVFGLARTIAIYPQYAVSQTACSSVRPIYLSFNYTDSYESLLVLMKAFALPELHPVDSTAPESTTSSSEQAQSGTQELSRTTDAKKPHGVFRLEHSMNINVTRAKLRPSASLSIGKRDESMQYYVETLVDEQIKAKTAVVSSGNKDIYWGETFDLTDLPSVLSSLSFRIKKKKASDGKGDISDTASIMSSRTGLYVQSMHSAHDETHSSAEIDLSTMPASKDVNLPVILKDQHGSEVGAMDIKMRREEHLILAEAEFEEMLALLQDFENGLTMTISERTPMHPTELANGFLNVFQANGTSEAWLAYLIREEVLGTQRHTQDRSGSAASAQKDVSSIKPNPDSGSYQQQEVGTLFRANSLLTRAFDSFMKRIGQPYLEMTLRVKIQEIVDKNEDCEIDPSMLKKGSDHETNWLRLMQHVKEVWSFIRYSDFNCPMELRRLLKRLREACIQRFDKVETVAYISVSGFLFLRFFSAAIWNPRLFGLVKAEPRPNAQRTLLLVSKTMMGLASLALFGVKQPWMASMNTFVSANRENYKAFVDRLCDVDLTPEQAPELAEVPDDQQEPSSPSIAPKRPPKQDSTLSSPSGESFRDVDVSKSRPTTAVATQEQGKQADPGSPDSTSRGYPPRSASLPGNSPKADSSLYTASGSPEPESEPESLVDFNTVESTAYTSSFSYDSTHPETSTTFPVDLLEPELDPEEISRPPSSSSLMTKLSDVPGDRSSMASQRTVIYVGPEPSASQQTQKPVSSAHSHRTSLASVRTAFTVRDNASVSEEPGDGMSVYESAIGSPNSDRFETASVVSDQSDDAMPPDISKSRQRTSGSSKLTDGTTLSSPSSIQTTFTRPSTAQSTPSLRSRASLDVGLNDPMRMVLERLPRSAREGFLTLPGLIDPAKNLAHLVNLWLDSVEIRIHRAAQEAAANGKDDPETIAPILNELDKSDSKLAQFHQMCSELKERAKAYRARGEERETERNAEEAEEDGITANNITVKWTTIAERMEASPHEFWSVRGGRPSSRDSRMSSVYAPSSFDSFERSSFDSRASVDTMRTMSTMSSAAPPPPAISRDPRGERDMNRTPKPTRLSLGPTKRYPDDPTPNKVKRGWARFTGGKSESGLTSSRSSDAGRKGSSATSLNSSGSDKTAKSSKTASSTKSRKKSPERTAEQTAMRKLGWM